MPFLLWAIGPFVPLVFKKITLFQDDRSEILERLSEKHGERAELQKELERYRECDPEVIDAMKEETKVAKEAANRWTGKIIIGRQIR